MGPLCASCFIVGLDLGQNLPSEICSPLPGAGVSAAATLGPQPLTHCSGFRALGKGCDGPSVLTVGLLLGSWYLGGQDCRALRD